MRQNEYPYQRRSYENAKRKSVGKNKKSPVIKRDITERDVKKIVRATQQKERSRKWLTVVCAVTLTIGATNLAANTIENINNQNIVNAQTIEAFEIARDNTHGNVLDQNRWIDEDTVGTYLANDPDNLEENIYGVYQQALKVQTSTANEQTNKIMHEANRINENIPANFYTFAQDNGFMDEKGEIDEKAWQEYIVAKDQIEQIENAHKSR